MKAERKRPRLRDGLAAGLDRADVVGMADTLGQGLIRVSEAWLPKQKLAVPQRCPNPACGAGPYSSLLSLRAHLSSHHPEMGDRERAFVCDRVRRAAVQQAMNGARRSP